MREGKARLRLDEATARQAAPDAEGVIALHAEWVRILWRLLPPGLTAASRAGRDIAETPNPAFGKRASVRAPGGERHAPPLGKAQRLGLVARGRALEKRVAATQARTTQDVALKLTMAASGLLLTGQWEKLVESAARDLETPPQGSALSRIVRRRRGAQV